MDTKTAGGGGKGSANNVSKELGREGGVDYTRRS